MNSKLPDDWQISDKQYHIFQKSKSYEISNTAIYIGEDLEFIIHVFYWCIPLDLEIYTKCNEKHLTWLKLHLVIISALELKIIKQKEHLSLTVPNIIDKPNESCKNSKRFEKNALSTTKKAFKRIKKNIKPATKNAPISQTWTTSRGNIKSIFAS